MQNDLFRQMQAETREAVAQRPPPKKAGRPAKAVTMYLVAAWNRQYRYWKIWRGRKVDDHQERSAAEAQAEKLSAVWIDRTIIEVKLPGEST